VRLVVDVENTHKERRVKKKSKTDMLPFTGHNQLVSVGIKDIDTGKKWYFFFNHSELAAGTSLASAVLCQELLLKATLMIGHNYKHDIMWLRSCGFTIPRIAFWDTSIAEYVMARGNLAQRLSLKELAEKYDLPRKKVDLIEPYFTDGKTFYDIPMPIVEEYGLGDLDTTHELFDNQQRRLAEPDNIGLVPTITMMNDFMYVLAKWQANGIKIDKPELEKVREEYVKERAVLTLRLQEIARKYIGDTPFNLNSGEDKSVILYSRRVLDKADWKKRFNIGTNEEGKKKRRPRMTLSQVKQSVQELTEIEYRTSASQCPTCTGTGRVAKVKKDGTQTAPRYICKTCNGCGVVYTKLNRIAGFKLPYQSVNDTAVNGFETSKEKLEALLSYCRTDEAKEFVKGLMRLNAINTYIETFCDGILTNLTKDDFLYTNFNQIVTATGRLSSTDPNFQNQPRGKTFPVRRAVISRFPGGSITEADQAQLEFRTAGELSGCPRVLKDILDKVDAHAFTRDTLCAAGQIVDRQDAKPHTFKPLYGGSSGTVAEQAYYTAFKKKFKGVTEWQERAGETVLNTKRYTLPTGRQYEWPHCKRTPWGKVEYFTQIVNYPVQGFATADIVPLCCILVDIYFEQAKLKSIPFLTVHDSVAVDTYPGEEAIVAELLAKAFLDVKQEVKRRYGYTLQVPLEVEVKNGPNWLAGKNVLTKAHEYVKLRVDTKEFVSDTVDDLWR
jgi:DNA polymerase I-like protein with 3'-5' exonuclease and polymerase domains